MAASVKADHPFVRRELPPAEGRAFFEQRDQPFKVEILDDLATKAKADGAPMPPTTVYEHGPFVDLCRGPHVESTGKIGPFKLLAVSGAYWRGDQKRPALQRIYGTVWSTQEELDTYLWRREEAKKRDHRKLGLQLDLFSFHDVSPGAAFWHPKGWRLYQTLRDAMREQPGEARLPGDLHAAARPPQALGAVGPLGALPRHDVPRRRRRRDVQPQADELPRVDVHLPLQGPLVPRPAAAAVGVRRAPSQRAERRVQRPDARPPLRHGRRPHLRPARPDRRRDRGAHGRDPRGLLVVRPRADADVRDDARRRPRRAGGLAGDRGDHADGARQVRAEVPGEAQGRRVLRAQDRHPDRGRPRPGVADGDDPGRPADAARAVRSLRTSTRRATSSGRSRSTARSTARSSGSSAC